jgi:putative component of toxin-antitoxin plasmid stabilization module
MSATRSTAPPVSGHEALLRDAQRQLEAISAAVDAALRRLDAGDFGDLKGLGAQIRDLRRAQQLVLEERRSVETQLGTLADSDEARGIDLEAARAQIESRLARLNRAVETEGLPGIAEPDRADRAGP